jgi:hypothetical protein
MQQLATSVQVHTFKQDIFDTIDHWDLSDVKRYVSKKFPDMDVDLAIKEYRFWMYLLACVSERLFAPNPDMDQVWHAHILHTRDYIHFCNEIKGQYIHHQHVEVDCQSKRREQLFLAAEQAFGSVPFRCDLTACSDHFCYEMTLS